MSLSSFGWKELILLQVMGDIDIDIIPNNVGFSKACIMIFYDISFSWSAYFEYSSAFTGTRYSWNHTPGVTGHISGLPRADSSVIHHLQVNGLID